MIPDNQRMVRIIRQHLRRVKALHTLAVGSDFRRLGTQFGQNQTIYSITSALILSPHPDDDIFGCGGVIADLAQRGIPVDVVYFSDGSRGNPNGAHDVSLVAVREAEAKNALAVLGVTTPPVFCRFTDGALAESADSITQAIQTAIQKNNPSAIFVPWIGDDHPDHQAISKALGSCQFTAQVWQYEIWSPLPVVTSVHELRPEVVEQKKQASSAHHSQMHRPYTAGIIGLNTYRGLQAGFSNPAEGFLVSTAADYPTLRDIA
jgi:LmbE family N-acetylglucosaminyl deacetylase